MPDFCSGHTTPMRAGCKEIFVSGGGGGGANGYCYRAGEFCSQVKFYEEFRLQKNCEITSAHEKVFGAG